MRTVFAVAVLGASPLLLSCGDRSEPFALQDGCYYGDDGTAVLKVLGEQGMILIPSPIRQVTLRPRTNGNGAYVEVSPGFYLIPPSLRAERSGQPMARFSIEIRPSPTIMIPIEAYGETPVRLGRPC